MQLLSIQKASKVTPGSLLAGSRMGKLQNASCSQQGSFLGSHQPILLTSSRKQLGGHKLLVDEAGSLARTVGRGTAGSLASYRRLSGCSLLDGP